MTSAGPLKAEQVKFLSFEGGGRAGLTICPGVARALSDLRVLRYDSARRQTGVEGFAGSSSGAVVATLLSCGYDPDELVTLLSEAAFDLVFRLEEFSLGQFSRLNGGCTQRNTPVPPWIMAPSVFDTFDDPAGTALNSAMTAQSLIADSLTSINPGLVGVFKRALQARIDRIPASADQAPNWLSKLAGTTSGELQRRVSDAIVGFGIPKVLAWYEREYPHVVFKLVEHILNPDNQVYKNQSNVFHVLKWDFGIFSGCAWRDYLDHLVTFARFRVAYGSLLPDLRIPAVEDFISAGSLEQLFSDRVADAESAAVPPPGESLPDFDRAYRGLRDTTFEEHLAEICSSQATGGPSPLVLSGANLSTQESHLFSAATTPWLCVADAVRIATSLPPIFKPVHIEAGDIPQDWPYVGDSFGEAHFLEGFWMDGGVYWNSPFDAFQQYESSDGMTLGVGIGIGKRVAIDDLTDYVASMVNVVYERNISATRSDLSRFLVLDNFAIAVTGPRMVDYEVGFYQWYGWWKTFEYFDLVSEPPF